MSLYISVGSFVDNFVFLNGPLSKKFPFFAVCSPERSQSVQKNICVKCDSQWEKVSSWMHLFTERMYGLRHSAVKEFFNWKLMKTSISVLFHCLALHFTLYTSISVNLNREKSLVHHPAARCGAQTATALWSCHDSFTDDSMTATAVWSRQRRKVI